MELIYYVDENDQPTGETAEKISAHHAHTKLHAAFSCYIFNDRGELLITQRAHGKKVWPSVWTNSCCGHPMPDESREDAIVRRARYELGIEISDIQLIISDYRYTTPPYNGIIENEYCPVFIARAKSEPRPRASEVESYEWVAYKDVEQLLEMTETTTNRVWSWWFKDQLKKIISHTAYTTELKAFTSKN
jgi:isopentenyl-diphosphate delta-isomerase